MASQREIRRRIGSARNIKQITRAMQFVAASKLRRAQESTLAARPYREKLDEVIADLAAVLGDDEHPLLAERDLSKPHNRLIVIITSDRGLAGALNTNTVRFVAREITEHPGDLKVATVGRKGRDAMRRARVPIAAHFEGFGDRPSFADVLPLARLVTDDFVAGTYDHVDVVYSRFVSTLVQKPDRRAAAPGRGRPRTPRASRATSSCSSPTPRTSCGPSCRATSRPACSRRCSSRRRARRAPGWSR